jgi:mRNA-degrading endonuclease toxin of MazEF toxin-antitoxin module
MADPKPMEIWESYFPSSDLKSGKNRPVLILSEASTEDDYLIVQITSKSYHASQYKVEIQPSDYDGQHLQTVSYIKFNKILSIHKSLLQVHRSKLTASKYVEITTKICQYIKQP